MTDLLVRLQEVFANRYAIERELGAGGMATVYLAHDRKLGRDVALKVLRPELAATLGSERFVREIEIAAKLAHPHILGVFDCGDADGLLYYTMPFVEGESLRDRLNREKQLPLDDALQITREVADALSFAHSHGVIHRDIKPENILLEAGHAVVSDFGIARAVSAAAGGRLTETGLAVGTPQYMSPEQAAGTSDVDGRSDVYSLGCVLYEMLAGEPPFTGPSAQAVVAKRLSTPAPRVSVLRDSVPTHVEQALERALARTPADRFPAVAEFAAALADHGRSSKSARVERMPLGRRRAVRFAVASVVLIVIAAAIASARWLRPGASGSRHPRTAIAVLPLENLSAQGPYGFFAGGLHDELLTQLAKVATLTVIGRTSVRGYEASTKRLGKIADELAVGSIVEGSVQVVGNRLRVNVQLIDPVTEAHIWAETYDRNLDDAFAVQSDIAQRIVVAVGATLSTAEAGAIAAVPTGNAEAYRLYLQAEGLRRSPGYDSTNLRLAQGLLERAVTLDPKFALAHASLSYVQGSIYFIYGLRPERRERQRVEAETALRLAPGLPQAYLAMGLVHLWGSPQDKAAGLEEIELALRGLPNDAEVWASLGYASAAAGRWDRWEQAQRRATELNPRDANLFLDLRGNTLWKLRRYEEATVAYGRALALAPDMQDARLARAYVFIQWQGRLDSLRAALESDSVHYTLFGSALYWRVRLALLERKPDRTLALLPRPGEVVFEMQDFLEPARLYAARAQVLRGDAAAAHAAFAGALQQSDSGLRLRPDDFRLHASRGLALAGLGRSTDARREADWLEASGGPIEMDERAAVLAQAGFADAAIEALERILAGPSWYTSAPMLRLDPIWDPIRNDPRFKALLVKYAVPKPVR